MKSKYCKKCGIQIFWNNNECGECIVIGVRNDESDFSSVFKKSLPFLFDPKPDKEKINSSRDRNIFSNYIFLFRGYETINPLPGKPL